MKKAEKYLADRENGLTYREIAEKYGITYQAAHASCMAAGGYSKKLISQRGCIYPNLRKWLNADKERQDRFFQATSYCCIRQILNGNQQPKKNVIDHMMKLTGMTYEELFAEE